MNKRHVTSFSPYLFVGMVMWVAVLKSGVHATLAGVILALFIPIKPAAGSSESPLKELEHDLHGVVAFGILPVFAFANAGVQMVGVSFDSFLHPVPVGIALGLLVGKQIGIFGLCWLSVVLGLVKLPNGLNFRSLYGVSLLCGVGFTMSLFIGSLAFEASGVNLLFDERLGILAGSLLSGVAGYLVLAMVLPKTSASSDGA
jgi:NhaA family Na+:H+ antiporter